MKVYFAGSIKGGRTYSRSYRLIVDAISRLGLEIFGAHVAQIDPNHGEPGPREVFKRDISWLRAADMVIAEVTQPSIGVGYEIAFALSLKKPVLCLYRKDVDIDLLSFMILGNAEPNFNLRTYDDSSINLILSDFIVSTND
ncbi:MAG: hypothetical protein C0617_14060 [Desulfuromonas sp.]|uniref:nucleoside 2-deoxyribosyltransferase n=1 Tax=Desulfuromonas sp. TaxID=892 RepID=UPI000CBB4C72|nr:nucleoside 2-deoxyribosyltransferase [Desulfuromonas sp.]PLX82252.1 MAG: hypothetical protein C0617_14060 [Desulfuromonas sp.]